MPSADLLLTAAIASAFGFVHVVGSRLTFLRSVPRSVWLSAAGGVSVAYVFMHLLPELSALQSGLDDGLATSPLLGGAERHLYLVALVGLATFYGLDRLARRTAKRRTTARQGLASRRVFWIHLGAFALYNLLIGYLLLHRDEADRGSLVMYGIAMGLHFVTNDQGLREHHGPLYDHAGRWLLATAPLLGWAVGLAWDVPQHAIGVLFALLAGSVVLNVLKEELPDDRDSRFTAFAGGAAAYAALVLAIG